LPKVAGRYSGDELDAALKAARRAIECSLKEINTEGDAGRTLIETMRFARSCAIEADSGADGQRTVQTA